MILAEGILEGAVDLHRHGYPEISDDLRTPVSDVEDLAFCRASGMRGVVLKSHVWPTTGRAQLLSDAVPGLTVVPSVTLNRFAGGLSPDVVEIAAKQGAGVVYLPTASAANDLARGGISHRISTVIDRFDPSKEVGSEIVDADGALTPAMRDVLDVLDVFPLVVYSGHLSVAESLALLREGRLADRYVMAHPDSDSIGASLDQVHEAAGLGAYIEICALGAYPQLGRVTHADLAGFVRRVGAERCIATSDYFFSWCPPSAAMLQHLADGLAAEGITRPELELMFQTNPGHLVGAHL